MSMSQLLAQRRRPTKPIAEPAFPFPSLDTLAPSLRRDPANPRHDQRRREQRFLAIKDGLKFVLDPLTQPLSWMLEGTLYIFTTIPWWIMIPLLVCGGLVVATKRRGVTIFGGDRSSLFFGLIDHLDVAMQTLAIIFVCTTLSVLSRRADRHPDVAI